MIVMQFLARLPRLAGFALYFLWELVLANAQVALEVVTPRHRMRPGIISVRTRTRGDFEVTLLANLISLTPGTLTLEIADDNSVLFIHGINVSTPREFRSRVSRLENRLLKVLR